MGAQLKKATDTATADTGSTSGMSFRCDTAQLKRVTSILLRIADRKTTMAMLGHVLVRTDGNGTTFSATDLNTSVVIRTPWVGSNGGVTIPSKAFADTVKGFAGAGTDVSRDTVLGVSLKSGSASTRLIGLHECDFPRLPNATSVDLALWRTVEAQTFAEMLDAVAFSVCKDETRFHLNGTLYECDDNGTARTVATDGHRLTKVERKLSGPTTKGVIIPAKGASEIVKLLGEGKRKGSCAMAISGNLLYVRYSVAGIGDVTLATKLIDAQFPPYEQVIPKDSSRLMTVERKPLIDALKRAAKLCSETRGVKLTLTEGTLRLTCDHPDTGDQTESIPADGNFSEAEAVFAIGINAKYMIETVSEIDCKHVTLAFAGRDTKLPELCPILVRATEHAVSYSVMESPFLGVIMPMRI